MKKLFDPSLKHNFFIFLVITLACYGFSCSVRYEQYKVWKETPTQYFVEETPMMTTLDSYFWLRWAREYEDGGIPEGRDLLRNFPDGKRTQHPVPPISYLIAKVAPSFDDNFYRAGFFLMIALSGIFIFPLAFYFFSIGYPVAGILGGLIGTVSYEYFIRTGIGRVDTDALMLFFLFSVSIFILKASRARNVFHILIYSCLGGGITYLLTLWWGKPAYVLPFVVVLFLSLLLHLRNQRQIIVNKPEPTFTSKRFSSFNPLPVSFLASALFFVCAIGFNLSDLSRAELLGTVTHYLGDYIQIGDDIELLEDDGTAFPKVLETITEAKHFPIETSLGRLLTSPILSAIGLIGFLLFFFIHWKKLIPILLIFVIGLLTFQGARRFGMFLGPFVGIGYGYLLTIFVAFFFRYFRTTRKLSGRSNIAGPVWNSVGWSKGTWCRLNELSGYGIALVFFFSVSSNTAIGRIPKPSIPTPSFLTFLELKDNLPTGSAIYTWWDYGYALTEIMNRATFHDGSAQTSPKTFFIARSLISDNPEELHNTISYLTLEGVGGIYRMIDENTSNEELLSNVLVNPPALNHENIFVMYTKDLIRKYRTIYSIGRWNNDEKRLGLRKGYQFLNCDRFQKNILFCREGTFDLNRSFIHSGVPIKETVIIDGGYVQRRISHQDSQGNYLQILTNGQRFISAHIVDEEIYRSNFNQMYLLGQYDPNLFDENYNSFPWTRVFHVKTLARSNNLPAAPSN